MTTSVRRPKFDDALAEARQTWSTVLPDRGYAAMWHGWQPIGYNGPIPILNDPGQRERELSGAARDVQIQQTAQEKGISSTQVSATPDATEGRAVPGGPAAAQGGFQNPPVGGSASRHEDTGVGMPVPSDDEPADIPSETETLREKWERPKNEFTISGAATSLACFPWFGKAPFE